MGNRQITKIAMIGVLSALSIVLYFFVKFPIPFLFPSYLDIQFSNLPPIIGGFAMGPVVGGLIVVVRTIVKLPFTSSMYAGEIADLMIGLATVLTSSIVYQRNRTKKGAFVAMIYGSIAWVLASIITNLLIVPLVYIPLYFGGNVEAFVGLLKVLPWFANLTVDNFMLYYILLTVIPFNLLLSSLVYFITFLVYKRVSNLIHKYD